MPWLSKTAVNTLLTPELALMRTATTCSITSTWLPAEVNRVKNRVKKERKPGRVIDLQADKQSCCIDNTSMLKRGAAFLVGCLTASKKVILEMFFS